ncbi:hypothetical protein COV58_01770 [Candidatus Roizmanbacteria bacterium CG11_big_fil_rev_8_21_14_0_20_36_8]|uniref:Uncharacterized protein n=2 Tax=Candidatus Roizmaniibacteriota TaxID=1752723 RepID=A0A2M6IUI4_9BACT|nr:MAG: hypothetical protein COV58_01770 [Candidatus Roizmanbacteria bacterium CG11_big_fil_rev_8_21_14_0_20_36_8]PIZ64816.1 MAG: hypothetical protein COY14_03690 [Candidatus Roizmanbacteria bacterium CG_4_10_14_0_2_um_filter_36_9]
MSELNPSHLQEWLRIRDSKEKFHSKLEAVTQCFFQHPSLDQRLVDRRGERVFNTMTQQLEARIVGYIGGVALPTGAIIISRDPFQVRMITTEARTLELASEVEIYDLLRAESGDFIGVKTRKMYPFGRKSYYDPKIPMQIQPEMVLDQLMGAYSNFSVWFGTNID